LLQKRQKIASASEDVKKRGPSHSAGKNVNEYSHFRKQYGGLYGGLSIN
jgi:hypothetical protein